MNWKSLRTNRALHFSAVALLALAGLYLAINGPRWQRRASLAAGLGAHMACSCRYIEGRDLQSCRSDFAGLGGMRLVRLSDDPAMKTVRASVPLLSTREAVFKPGFGCMPDKP